MTVMPKPCPPLALALTQRGPWLHFDLGAPLRVLSWSLNRPGFVTARAMVWREVHNADLTPDLDVAAWFADALAQQGWQDAVAFLTSRDIATWTAAQATVDGITAQAVATVGLSNAEHVGARVDYMGRDWDDPPGSAPSGWGTINIGLRLSFDTAATQSGGSSCGPSCGLTDAALIELLAIAVQARTAAVMAAGIALPTGIATGTGTDCIAVAAPPGPLPYAGLHTAVGEAAGRAVRDAVAQGVEDWCRAYPMAKGGDA